MQRVVFVISGGDIGDPAFLRERAVAMAPVAVICADRGARNLEAAGLLPALIVGDMDSLDQASREKYEANGCRIIRYPQEKDETDTELALREAFLMAPSEIFIWGALGHRIDHTLANISLLAQGMEKGVEVTLIDGWCELFLIGRRKVIEGEPGQTVSLLPYGGAATGVTLTGMEYPLNKAVMEPSIPSGVSNRMIARTATIEVDSGYLLAVRYFKPGVFPGEVTE